MQHEIYSEGFMTRVIVSIIWLEETFFIFNWFISCRVCTSWIVISIFPNSDLEMEIIYKTNWLHLDYMTIWHHWKFDLNSPSSPKVLLQYDNASVFHCCRNFSICKSCYQIFVWNSIVYLLAVSVAGTLLCLLLTPCLQFKSKLTS